MTEEKLFKLKKEIEEAKSKVSNLKGREESLLQQLKNEWGCDSYEQAQEKVQKMKDQINQLDDEIKEKIEELEEKYEL